MAYSKFDEKSKAGPVWKGPLDASRTCTDMPFFVAFALLMSLWILIAIFVFSTSELVEVQNRRVYVHEHLQELSMFIRDHFYNARYMVLGFFTLSFVLLVILVTLFRWATKFTVHITIFLMFVLLVALYGLISCSIDSGFTDYIIIAPLTIIAIVYIGLMYAVVKVGVDMVCKVITESCQAIFFFPSTLVFMLGQFILHLLVAAFAMSVYVYLTDNGNLEDLDGSLMNNQSVAELDEMDEMSEDSNEIVQFKVLPFHAYVFQAINVWGFIWANLFIMGLGRMVLTATFATWYHMEDKKLVPYTTIARCFVRMMVHHPGTIAFASSFFWVFPMFYVVFKFGRDRVQEMYKRPVLILSWFIIILKFPFDALSVCAIHGNNFYESAKDSYILMMKNPMSFLVINTITECVIFVGSLLVPVLLLILTILHHVYFCDWNSNGECSATIFLVTLLSLLMSLTFFMVFRAASNTLRFCYLEESKFNGESEMGLYEMHVDDTSVRNDVLVY